MDLDGEPVELPIVYLKICVQSPLPVFFSPDAEPSWGAGDRSRARAPRDGQARVVTAGVCRTTTVSCRNADRNAESY